ncbi:MAG: NAD-dependent epimerase/dehydratase family protein, partial [Chloroflexota bacterium]|nr:NAD-dependent epimerase/dehydratase family protein [Chloroflexota bacterium]
MKILITGATGFIGSHLCHRLVSEGHQVTAFHRSTSDISLLKDLNLQHAIGDITDCAGLARAVQGYDAVIHAAAYIYYWRKY